VPESGFRVVFAGGGTGGHLFPALAVADELRRREPRAAISFVGARRGLEGELVPRSGYPLRRLRLSGMKGRGPVGKASAAAAAAWAVLSCTLWMLASRPHLVVGVGGYASGPAVVAAKLLRVRTMVLEQNHFPGATNRWLAPRVDLVCLPSEAARERLGGLGLVTGNPVRPAFLEIGEPPGGPTLSLLVFGGSRGARSINRAMVDALEPLARIDPAPNVVHQTGADDAASVTEAARRYPAGRYDVHAFIDDMPSRLAAADLVVARAGATTLAELAAAGRPAILVPYPHAADDHQRHNAETVERTGGAVTLLDRELTGERLAAQIAELAADPARRHEMARAVRGLARPDATRSIADAALRLVEGRSAGGGARVS
jgi:UDP-N-acetylglucosamine--N-acetylmuramyl-(pentapeptide) pyrophosphoryl-undecaprenol N-acetylglucosamine transferase